MASTPAVSPPLVWVTHGKTQHPAFLLESKESDTKIRWASNNKEEWVPNEALEETITPRRRRRPDTFISSFHLTKSVTISPKRPLEAENNKSDEDLEILFTIQPPTPKRAKQRAKHPSTSFATPPVPIPIPCSDPDQAQNSETPLLHQKNVNSSEEPFNLPPAKGLEHASYMQGVGSAESDEDIADSTDEDEALTLVELAAKNKKTFRNTQGNASTSSNFSATFAETVATETPKGVGDAVPVKTVSQSPLEGVIPKTAAESSFTAPKKFSARSSAYVQNLAEICYVILNDQRWKAEGIARKQLFAWERSEDLKAIVLLSQMYEPVPKEKIRCTCLLCREDDFAKLPATCDANASSMDNNPSIPTENLDDDNEDDRAINLFCRLYYRKGPWFRLDDLYTRYYAPKKESRTESTVTALGESTDNSKSQSRRFFEGSLDGGTIGEKTPAKTRILFDETQFQANIHAIKALVADIERLQSLGLIRSFEDEQECGKTVGSVGHGVLNAEERLNILHKLGGSKKKATGRKSVDTNGTKTKENIIWKQMSQQQSIVFTTTKSCDGVKSRVLLPVCHHVNGEVLSKLAASVVLGASQDEYLPTVIWKAKVKSTLDEIAKLATRSCTLQTCFRLQEAPASTLRRCCRLFLCATSGPGDMRGNGTNGWKSLEMLPPTDDIPFLRVVPPPGINAWHSVTYPGLSSRFKLAYHGFKGAHSGVDACLDVDLPLIQVFQHVNAFRTWEISVELRAFVDYQVELNEMILSQDRRKQRDAESKGSRSDTNSLITENCNFTTDFINVLNPEGRFELIQNLLLFISASDVVKSEETIQTLNEAVEHTLGVFEELSQPNPSDDVVSAKLNGSALLTECEKVIFVCSIIVRKVLELRHSTILAEEKASMTSRPWLRHLWWEGVLSYVLWDCIPTLEKRGFYGLASQALEVLVFGSTQSRNWKEITMHDTVCDKDDTEWGASTERVDTAPFCEYLISRRARGKAQERLIIDYGHILRNETKLIRAGEGGMESMTTAGRRKPNKKGQKIMKDRASELVATLCSMLITRAAKSASIPFSAIRCLARRLKQPLVESLDLPSCLEAGIFGFRLGVPSKDQTEKKKGYSDWCPIVDEAVAVALAGQEASAGHRCSYVGFEDSEPNGKVQLASLNVEQLAAEYYSSGRLPKNNPKLDGGGWVGWHDEGGYLRALFRILCADSILGMDNGCGSVDATPAEAIERATIHLTPYQGAPFDLHVGSWTNHRSPRCSVRGFFARRKENIDKYLCRLEQLDSQAIADLVFDTVKARLGDPTNQHQRLSSDVALSRDLQQLRTLSMLAAGFGGALLAAAFRCMLFDYRHYSGGLPDLLLARAHYAGDESTLNELVNLGEWVGEGFSAEAQAEKDFASRAAMLIDRDDEFLGCSKMGDSASGTSNRWGRPKAPQKIQDVDITLPESLKLVHNGQPVQIQCMFVEVKSSNDRLDGRQEDWLNLLDRVGNARVCKFVDTRKQNQELKKPPAAKTSKKSACKPEATA